MRNRLYTAATLTLALTTGCAAGQTRVPDKPSQAQPEVDDEVVARLMAECAAKSTGCSTTGQLMRYPHGVRDLRALTAARALYPNGFYSQDNVRYAMRSTEDPLFEELLNRFPEGEKREAAAYAFEFIVPFHAEDGKMADAVVTVLLDAHGEVITTHDVVYNRP